MRASNATVKHDRNNNQGLRIPMIHVEGILVPEEWDDQGAPSLFGISTNDERLLILDPNNLPPATLLADVKSRVCIRGSIIKTPSGRDIIRIVEYTNLDQKAGAAGNDSGGGVDALALKNTDGFRPNTD